VFRLSWLSYSTKFFVKSVDKSVKQNLIGRKSSLWKNQDEISHTYISRNSFSYIISWSLSYWFLSSISDLYKEIDLLFIFLTTSFSFLPMRKNQNSIYQSHSPSSLSFIFFQQKFCLPLFASIKKLFSSIIHIYHQWMVHFFSHYLAKN